MLKVKPQPDPQSQREKALLETVRLQASRIEELQARLEECCGGQATGLVEEVVRLKQSRSDLVCRVAELEKVVAMQKEKVEVVERKNADSKALIERLSAFARALAKTPGEESKARTPSATCACWLRLSAALALVPFQSLERSLSEISGSLRAIARLPGPSISPALPPLSPERTPTHFPAQASAKSSSRYG